VESFLPILSQAGFEIEVEEDVESLLWGKLVVNAGINPLTALLRVRNGDLLTNEHTRVLMGDAARETAAVAAARGIRLPFRDPVAQIEGVAERTAMNRSSMLQDVLRGAPTEIDAICGAVAAAADGAGVGAPVNRSLWRLVRATVARQEAPP
jgi:2-dehydropantoate 2-reductase